MRKLLPRKSADPGAPGRARNLQRFPVKGPTLARSAGVKSTPFGVNPVAGKLVDPYKAAMWHQSEVVSR